MANLSTVIIRPLITEKTSLGTELFNRYGFLVQAKSNKNQIKQAIELFYGVKVVAVRTAVISGKVKRTAKSVRKTPSYKKALVELAKGQKIEFFKGV
jgi:large subunit ribosomal protein L23